MSVQWSKELDLMSPRIKDNLINVCTTSYKNIVVTTLVRTYNTPSCLIHIHNSLFIIISLFSFAEVWKKLEPIFQSNTCIVSRNSLVNLLLRELIHVDLENVFTTLRFILYRKFDDCSSRIVLEFIHYLLP